MCSLSPDQEGASAGVAGPIGGLLPEALRDPAEAAGRRTLPRGSPGALGRSDSTEDQRRDQQALKDLEVWQRCLRHASFFRVLCSRSWSRSKKPL